MSERTEDIPDAVSDARDRGYRPVRPPADPERDKRVAARRAADAAQAGLALDRLYGDRAPMRRAELQSAYAAGWHDGYAASEEHHNGHYGVADSDHAHTYGMRCPVGTCNWPMSTPPTVAAGPLFGSDVHGGTPDGRGSFSIGACDWPAMQCTGHPVRE
jgi:hypothetical protein